MPKMAAGGLSGSHDCANRGSPFIPSKRYSDRFISFLHGEMLGNTQSLINSGWWLRSNGLEMIRPASEGRAAWAETTSLGSVRSAQDQLQGKDTPAGRRESITRSWHRD